MIDFEKARQLVLSRARPLGTLRVPLGRALDCVIAESVKARDPIPLFDGSAVDGFAVHVKDVASASATTPARLVLQYTIRAGDAPGAAVKRGHAVKVLTGAPIPPGTTAVVMKEHVLEGADEIRVVRGAKREDGIRRQGAEFAKGTTVFARGTFITPAVIGMLATLGCATVKVYKKPRVAVIVTGNELRPPSSKLRTGEIRDSNSFAIAAALRAIGIQPVMTAHARDTEIAVRGVLSKALRKADVVITVGGVSVGDYDHVKDVLASLKVTRVFWSVAMKPGKPNYFGTAGKTLVFGLPGNPVSALVSFMVFVKPALARMMGDVRPSARLKAVLTKELVKKPGRIEFVRGAYALDAHDELAVTPTTGQDSHMVGGIAAANGLIVFPKDAARLNKGSLVDVLPLEW